MYICRKGQSLFIDEKKNDEIIALKGKNQLKNLMNFEIFFGIDR